jgi:ABC-type branched-subunit amino acid transport system substrate-binding protein
MKKWLSVAAVVVLSLTLVIGVACGGGGDGGGGIKTLKTGAGLPMTGIAGAALGMPCVHAYEVLKDDYPLVFNVAGQDYQFETILEDNYWTAAGGVATATKFIYEDGVKIMSQGGPDACGASQTMCEQAGVMLFTAGCGPEMLGPHMPHTFQVSATFIIDTPVLFQYIKETYPEVQTVSVAFTDLALGHAMGEAAIDAMPYFGFDLVSVDWVPVGMTELYPLATKLADIDADLILCDVTILKPMREMGYEGKTAYISWAESYGESIGWENYQGAMIYCANPYGGGLTPELEEIFNKIEERYGDDPSHGPYQIIVNRNLVPQIMQEAGTVDDVDKMLEVMWSGVYFDTPLGPMRFGGKELIGINNILLWPGMVHEIRDHDCVPVYEMTPDEAYDLACDVYGDLYMPK